MSMSTFKRILKSLEVDTPEGATSSELLLQNNDILPVPLEHRKWKAWNFVTFWIADSFNLNTFMIASSMIAAGLKWYEAWICVILGYGIAAFFLVLNALPGAYHHITFPAFIRSSFGTMGGLWPVFNRAATASIWFGVQSWIGGECMYTLLLSIFPSIANIPNGIPNSGTDTAHFLTFFLFSLIQLIPLWFPIHSLRHLFTAKAIFAPIAGLALFGWCVKEAGGTGPLLTQGSTITGPIGWIFVASLMGCISNMATLIVNAVDFASRADKPSAVLIPQLIALPITFSITSLFGILIASSTYSIFGEFVWSPLDILAGLLEKSNFSSGARAGVAFISMGFILAQIGVNVAANSISVGCDLTALLPRYINIRRGSYVAAIVGFSMCPWNLLSSTNNFASYLSAYSVFLSSIAGVMIANYYIVAKRRIKVDDLYTMNSEGRYHYWHGINLRAFAAYLAGIAINIVGFVGAIGINVPLAATRIYTLSFFTGFITSAVVYIILNKIFPVELPSIEECQHITIGTPEWQWAVDSRSMEQRSIDEKTSGSFDKQEGISQVLPVL